MVAGDVTATGDLGDDGGVAGDGGFTEHTAGEAGADDALMDVGLVEADFPSGMKPGEPGGGTGAAGRPIDLAVGEDGHVASVSTFSRQSSDDRTVDAVEVRFVGMDDIQRCLDRPLHGHPVVNQLAHVAWFDGQTSTGGISQGVKGTAKHDRYSQRAIRCLDHNTVVIDERRDVLERDLLNPTNRDRTIISMTKSIIDPFGSGVVVPGTGMLLNSAMHNFNPVPGQIGSIAPWKRSAHNGVPVTVLREDGRPFLAIGGVGGTKIISGVAQVLVNMFDRGWSVQEAVAAPRVHNEGWDSQIDAQIDANTRGELQRMGHQLEVISSGYGTPGFSRINAIAVSDDNRLMSSVDIFSEAGAAVSD